MAKSSSRRKPEPESEEVKLQREALALMREEAEELHQLSLMVMAERGILPPFYGGDHLGEKREIIPIWGIPEEEDAIPEFALICLRVMPGVEPNAELQAERDTLGLENDFAFSEFAELMNQASGKPIQSQGEFGDMAMVFILAGQQVNPIGGYTRDEMIDHIADMMPYAAFVTIPTKGEGDDIDYEWGDLDNYRVDVLCAESPQMLETMVWDYRLTLAIQDTISMIEDEGDEPDDELMVISIGDLVGMYELDVINALRFYGTTSAIREKQEELDIIREDNNDLVVRPPLKPQIEPVPMLKENREDLNELGSETLLRLDGDSDMMENIWPRLRSNNVYCLRSRFGNLVVHPNGELKLDGYSEQPILEWIMADTLGKLHRSVHLFGLYEFLSVCRLVKGKTRIISRLS